MRLAFTGALPALSNKSPLVTSTRALAGIANQQFSSTQLASGARSWERPEIYTLDAWLTSIWQEVRYSKTGVPTLLSPAQEHFLWQQVIAQRRPDLFDTGSIARLASQAADVVAEYAIPLEHEAWSEQRDAEEFREWLEAFTARCQAEGWMARRDILRRLKPHTQPIFAGFDKAPAPGKFLSVSTARAERIVLKQTSSFVEELDIAARWARARYEAAPNRSVAVFVPGLRGQASVVDRVFRSVFYPGRALKPDNDAAECVFHVNAPKPLVENPLIASGLLLLELAWPRISQADATAILRCPFLTGAAEERPVRAKADMNLRRTRELELSLNDLEKAAADCPRLRHTLRAVRTVLERRRKTNDLPRWARFFSDLLNAAGWPGDWELSAQEQRIVEMWKDALSTLSALGMVSGPVVLETAAGQLKRLLAIGGPETGDWLSPVQILDANDASGLSFDAAFLTGMDDATWPASDPMSPLIPARLQRAVGVPESDVMAVRKAGLDATRALANSAPLLAGSFHERLAPQLRVCVSRVSTRFDEEIWEGKRPIESFAPSELDDYRETHGPPFDLSREARGGTSLIKKQSECPFKAFAATRLRAALPEDASFGFDPLDRGKFVHRALEKIWGELRDSRALHAASEEQLREIIARAVESALAEQNVSDFYAQASEVERQRLQLLLFEWLTTVEKQRTGSFTVEALEQEQHISVGGLSLKVRMDRVDRLANGSLVLIDYKTGGGINKNCLLAPNPAEPQLLIYAAAQESSVEGLLFGCVAPRELRFAGFSRSKLIGNSRTVEVEKEWDTFLSESQEAVERLAGEYIRGEAAINPCHKSCGFCDLPALCRKDEQAALAEDE